MNMLVSTAIAGTAVPAAAAEPDPIFAAIEEHGRAYAQLSIEIVKTDDFEAAIPDNKRRTRCTDEKVLKVFETDDPRWLKHMRTLHDLHQAESDAECALASIGPTTTAGICALLKYGADVEERGCAWPELYEDENAKWGRSWYYFVNRNIVECLEGMASTAA